MCFSRAYFLAQASPTSDSSNAASSHHHHSNIPGCLSSGTGGGGGGDSGGKGDFVLQTGHIIEIVTKLFLVVQNATGRPPQVNIATEFEAHFGPEHRVTFAFRLASAGHGSALTAGGTVRLIKKGSRFEVLM